MVRRNKVLIVATSSKAKGGINSVIHAYSQSEFWKKWNCYWLETHIDKNSIFKIGYLIKAIIQFVILIPFFHIVHIHLSEPPSAFRKTIFLRLAKLLGKPVIAHFHSFSTKTTIDGKYQNLYYTFFNTSDKIIVLSNSWKNWILYKWPQLGDKVEVLYNPCTLIDNDHSVPRTKTIIYAGALNERKGYSDLIKGFALIAGKYKDWRLFFAGNGEVEKAKKLSFDLKVKDQIEFTGWISGVEKDRLFKTASVFCLPSYAEGFPMAVLDAWAYGLPVITTLVGGLPDIIIDGENALVIEPGDQIGISKALEKLIIDDNLRLHLSDESLKLSRTIFSLTEITGQLSALYSTLIRKK